MSTLWTMAPMGWAYWGGGRNKTRLVQPNRHNELMCNEIDERAAALGWFIAFLTRLTGRVLAFCKPASGPKTSSEALKKSELMRLTDTNV